MAIRETIPKIPNIPETSAVNRLIGIWIPKLAPKMLTKNNNNAPITSFTEACPINFNGFTGAPIVSKSTMTESMIIMIIVELIYQVTPNSHN